MAGCEEEPGALAILGPPPSVFVQFHVTHLLTAVDQVLSGSLIQGNNYALWLLAFDLRTRGELHLGSQAFL